MSVLFGGGTLLDRPLRDRQYPFLDFSPLTLVLGRARQSRMHRSPCTPAFGEFKPVETFIGLDAKTAKAQRRKLDRLRAGRWAP